MGWGEAGRRGLRARYPSQGGGGQDLIRGQWWSSPGKEGGEKGFLTISAEEGDFSATDGAPYQSG